MRVMITGHEGYIGTVLRQVFAAAGHDVVGLDTGYFRGCVLGPEPAPIPATEVDLRSVEPAHLEGIDAVVHLGALSNDPIGDLSPQSTYDINQHASVRLARAAKQAGVGRFLYASTCSVYGASGSDLVTESAELRPVTAYAISKVKVEEELHELADDTFSPVSLRNATAFGFSPHLRGDIVLNNLTAWAVLTGEIKVLSDGTPWRPLVHIRDISAAFLAAAEAPVAAVHDRAFNIGSEGCNLQVHEIAEIVEQTVPGSTVNITGEAGNDPRSYRVDFSAFREAVPTYRAVWTVEDGARELYDAYREHGLTLEAFSTSFTRLAWLKHLQELGRLDRDLRWTAGR
jgi:nucleoside-diphosphate-sugar epimerase